MTGFKVQWVQQKDCYKLWKKVKHLLAPAIAESNGRWQPEYVFSSLVGGYHTLWIISNDDEIVAAFISQVSEYPERKILSIHYLGGQGIDDWYWEMSNRVVEYARSLGCDGIECNARFGFWKWFKHDDFIKKSCYYEKKI